MYASLKIGFQFIREIVRDTLLTYGMILLRKVISSKVRNERQKLGTSKKILMLHEICPSILTQAENPNSKD